MMQKKLPTSEAGVYLFRAPAKVSATLDRQLLIVFVMEKAKTCGLVLFPGETPTKDLFSLLETLHEKANKELGVPSAEIELKLFGASNSSSLMVPTIQTWARAHGLKLGPSDTGRNASRQVLVHCATGKVSVSYAESLPAGVLPFLPVGSARLRLPQEEVDVSLLVLTGNPVRRLLARQAIEEHRNWTGLIPTDPAKVVGKKKFMTMPWNLLLIFDDLTGMAGLQKWLHEVRRNRPEALLCWAGYEAPDFDLKTSYLRHISPLDPETVVKFKKELTEAVEAQPPASTTGDVLPFRSRKGKKA